MEMDGGKSYMTDNTEMQISISNTFLSLVRRSSALCLQTSYLKKWYLKDDTLFKDIHTHNIFKIQSNLKSCIENYFR